jgi:hypothetical protein
LTVTVLPSSEISGSLAARSGTGFSVLPGRYEYSGRWSAVRIPIAYV